MVMTNNVTYDNTCENYGGGWYCESSDVTYFVNETVYGNSVTGNPLTGYGGGIHCAPGNSYCYANNCAFWNNTATISGDNLSLGAMGTTLDTDNCCWENGILSIEYTYCYLVYGDDNITSNPNFSNPSNGDFHIPWNSPCADQGELNTAYLPSLDFEGDRRVYNDIPDIGADEYTP